MGNTYVMYTNVLVTPPDNNQKISNSIKQYLFNLCKYHKKINYK